MRPTPVKKAAEEMNLPVLQPESPNEPDFREKLADIAPELGVVVAYGSILREPALRIPDSGFINLHASALPAYRGAAPINRAIINGESESGVTVIRMVEEMDAGPILAREKVSIHRDDNAGDLHDRLAEVGSRVLADVVDCMDAGEPPEETPQDDSAATYAPMLSREDRQVDWSRPAGEVRDLVRGLTPWPGARSTLHSEAEGEIGIQPLRMTADESADVDDSAAGTVLEAAGDGLVVKTGRGTVTITRLKPAGGSAMSGADFLNGNEVRPGDRFV
jgi:methionyl-tRNA formyltransferase